MKRVSILLVVLALGVCICGCSFVKPSDAVIIDQNASNAQAINARVQADPAMPAYAKTWWDAEARTWVSMSDWAHRRAGSPAVSTPTATTQPSR